MIKRVLFLGILIGLLHSAAYSVDFVRLKRNINREWKFVLSDIKGAEVTDFNDGDWQNISLPHSFSIPYFMWSKIYNGYGWYRKVIDIPTEWKDKNVTLEFEGSFIETEVYINGTYLGKHIGGYTGFFFDITRYLNAGKNVIAVRVNNLWKPDVAPRAGDHQFSGGIYRDVYLNVTDKLHVDVYGTFAYTAAISKKEALCEIQTEIRNNYPSDKNCIINTEIESPAGKVVSKVQSKMLVKGNEVKIVRQVFPRISEPQLWSPESPQQYKAVTTVMADGKVMDKYETTFGLRWFDWTADKGFFLNGEHYYLLGANVHQDQAGWGDAVTNAAMRRDVQMIKDAGFNCIRGSHYPHDPAFVQACDEIGLIFFSENAFWGTGGAFGDRFSWNHPTSSCYPANPEYRPKFDESVLAQLKEMIKIHRNHASIAAWSMCNEPFFTDWETFKDMKSLLNQVTDSASVWDPTRKVAIGGAQRGEIDRLGKNVIAFYNGDGASRTEFQNPGVPNLVSEYGSTTSYRPGRFFAGWGDVVKTPGYADPWNPPTWRSGQIIWCGFDHGTIFGTGLATMGMIDYFRLPKRQYYWYVEALKKGNRNPQEPEWPSKGIPARLGLKASNNIISSTDGIDDAQLVVTVLDEYNRHISNNVPIELRILSGPGEFPTGRMIRFVPPSQEEASDIAVRDGQAAIAFRSYHAGKTVIQAIADGLEPAVIEIITLGTPMWEEGVTVPVAGRPYHRYEGEVCERVSDTNKMLLATYRPTWVSSSLEGTNKAYVNDGDVTTFWKPVVTDREKWWKLALEASYCISKIQVELPEADVVYQYKIEVSVDDLIWKEVISDRVSSKDIKVRTFQGDFGCDIAFVRVSFISEEAGLTEVRIGGK
jgi:hypothetical protein